MHRKTGIQTARGRFFANVYCHPIHLLRTNKRAGQKQAGRMKKEKKKEIKIMNTSTMELTMDELETVNGGDAVDHVIGAVIGGGYCAMAGFFGGLLAAGPVGAAAGFGSGLVAGGVVGGIAGEKGLGKIIRAVTP